MANKRSKVTSHQKQTNNASEKPLDSIETLVAMPRSEFSENQLARNSITVYVFSDIFGEAWKLENMTKVNGKTWLNMLKSMGLTKVTGFQRVLMDIHGWYGPKISRISMEDTRRSFQKFAHAWRKWWMQTPQMLPLGCKKIAISFYSVLFPP